jgi:hypothetical protein
MTEKTLSLFKNTLAIVLVAGLLIFPSCAEAISFYDLKNFTESFSWSNRLKGLTGHNYFLGLRKFFNSFTSYQFPNPNTPGQDPLSRLEFPIDQWFMGLNCSYSGKHWSINGEGWVNLNRESRHLMQDSDWDDDNMPSQKTIFSQSGCRMNRGILVDIQLSAGAGYILPDSFQPVCGWRMQCFSFTTHDGDQETLDGDILNLPGDGIDFDQTFYHYFLGGAYSVTLNPTWYGGVSTPLTLKFQLDYGFVRAKNEDLHLLRAGNRVTEELTSGHCWHLAASAGTAVNSYLRAGIEADFKRMLTNGSHKLTNSLFEIDFSFDGSSVWSDQLSFSAFWELDF